MGDSKEISIHLSKEVVDQINNILQLENSLNHVIKSRNHKPTYDIEDFIIGCIHKQLAHIDMIRDLEAYEHLGETRQLKNRIKEVAESKGWNQKRLTEVTGINKGTASTIFSNNHQPSIDYFLRIWIALGCPPIEELFYRE
ncbi:helix-turn-helix transcriptional regulator [Priestia megaterium]